MATSQKSSEPEINEKTCAFKFLSITIFIISFGGILAALTIIYFAVTTSTESALNFTESTLEPTPKDRESPLERLFVNQLENIKLVKIVSGAVILLMSIPLSFTICCHQKKFVVGNIIVSGIFLATTIALGIVLRLTKQVEPSLLSEQFCLREKTVVDVATTIEAEPEPED